jgi:hypothetical protein
MQASVFAWSVQHDVLGHLQQQALPPGLSPLLMLTIKIFAGAP